MFAERIITTNSPPRETRPGRELLSNQNSVRVYRKSPRTIAFQLRLTTRFTHVDLTEDEAQTLIEALELAIAEGRGP